MAKLDLSRIDALLTGLQERVTALEDARREGSGEVRRVWWDASPLCDLWFEARQMGESRTLAPIEAEPGVWYEARALGGDEMEILVKVESGLRQAQKKAKLLDLGVLPYTVLEFEMELQSLYRHCRLEIVQQRRKAQDRAEGVV